MNRGSSSEAVRAFQRDLELLGFPLVRWGADGSYGGETADAAGMAAFAFGIVKDPDELDIEPPQTPDWIVSAIHDLTNARPTDGLVHDVRDESGVTRKIKRTPIKNVDTVCLHQMAVASVGGTRKSSVGVPQSLSRYGQKTGPVYVPKGTGKYRRWVRLEIHYNVTCGDNAAGWWMQDVDRRMWHGHGWNGRSVGVEVEGYYAGEHDLKAGEYKHFWKPKSRPRRLPMVPSEQQIQAACAVVRHAVARVRELGGEIEFIGAHRQSFARKASDPGELIWKAVALPMMDELDLTEAPTLKRGREIPSSWDDRNIDVRY